MITYTNASSLYNQSNGGIYGTPYIQPNPIGNTLNQGVVLQGNMLNIGSNGYNTGYVNPYSNMYFNPYAMREQQEKIEKQAKQHVQTQSSIWKKLAKSVNEITKSIPEELEEEHLKRFDPVEPKYDKEFFMAQRVIKCMQLSTAPTKDMLPNYRLIAIQNEMERMEKVIPKDISLVDFFNSGVGGMLYYDIDEREYREKQKDLTKLYNKDQYSELLKLHAGSANYFSSVFGGKPLGNITIDDMEVKLPSHLQDEYHMRKRMFLASIVK